MYILRIFHNKDEYSHKHRIDNYVTDTDIVIEHKQKMMT